MTETIKLNAEVKEKGGTGTSKALRKVNKVPGIVYGGDLEMMVALPLNELKREYYRGNFFSKLADITLADRIITAIPREVQLDPVTDIPVHIDFQEIQEDTRIKVSVHIKIANEDKCPGVKKGGMLNVVYRNISCRCYPKNVPTHIEVDVSGLEIGHNLRVNDITLPEGLMPIDSSNFTLVSVSGRVEESATGETEQAES